MIAGKCRPTMVMAKVPVITSAVHGSTNDEDPFADLMLFTKNLEKRNNVLSTSLILIHPYMDVANMGSGGNFTYTGGQWESHHEHMGPTAVFAIGPVRVIVMSRATYDWADEQLRAVGLDSTEAKFIVAKNPMNYRLAYGAIANGIFILDTPGPTPATLRHVKFQKLQRPYFPPDSIIANLQPTILGR
jgi:microcystin degradation protein MlrC